MATHIASFPIRPTHVASNYLAITCRADSLISLNQIGSPLLHTLDPDAIDAVYNHVVRCFLVGCNWPFNRTPVRG